MARITDIAVAVANALNGHSFSQVFAAGMSYRPVFDLRDMKGLRVSVVPRGVEMSTAGRGLTQHDVQIDIGVQKKLAADDAAEIDSLLGLVQEIAEFVRTTGHFDEATWVKTENTPIYSPEHLSELRQFTSVLTLTLRTMTE